MATLKENKVMPFDKKQANGIAADSWWSDSESADSESSESESRQAKSPARTTYDDPMQCDGGGGYNRCWMRDSVQ